MAGRILNRRELGKQAEQADGAGRERQAAPAYARLAHLLATKKDHILCLR
jgi:hypothetical protein